MQIDKIYTAIQAVDNLGRVLIPQEMRVSLGWQADDDIDITYVANAEMIWLSKKMEEGENNT